MSPSVGWLVAVSAVALVVLLLLLSNRISKIVVLAGAVTLCLVMARSID